MNKVTTIFHRRLHLIRAGSKRIVAERKQSTTSKTDRNIKYIAHETVELVLPRALKQTSQSAERPPLKLKPQQRPPADKHTIIKIIIIMTLKGAIRDFSQSPHYIANPFQHARSSGQGTIVRKSRANTSYGYQGQNAVCHSVRRDNPAGLKSHLFFSLFPWLKTLTG